MTNTIADLDALRKRSGLALTDGTDAATAAQVILDGLAGALQARGPLAEVIVTGERHVDVPRGELPLRKTPVKSVTELRHIAGYGGTATVVSATTYEAVSWGIVGNPGGILEVDYTAGPDAGVVAAAKHVLLEAATRIVKRMDADEDGLKTIAQEGYRVEFITDAFTDDELALLPSRKKIR